MDQQPDTQGGSAPTPEQQPMQAPTPVAAATAVDPGKGLGVAGLVFAFFMPLVGLILSIIAKGKSKKAGFSNGLAMAGIIISSIGMVVGVIIAAVLIAASVGLVAKCKDLGPGVHYDNGTTFTCS